MAEDERASIKIEQDTRKRLKMFAVENEMKYSDAIDYLLDQEGQ